MLADRRAAIEGFGLPLDAGLALEAQAGPETLAVAQRRRGPLRRRRGARRLRAQAYRLDLTRREKRCLTYFVTGATGFIGRHLVEQLLAKREGQIHVLVREGSRERLEELIEGWGRARADRAGRRRPDGAEARVSRGQDRRAPGQRRSLLPPRRDLRHDRRRRNEQEAQRRRARATPSSWPTRSTPGSSTTCPRSPRRARTRASSARTCSTRARSSTIPTTARSSSPRRSPARRPRAPGACTGRPSSSATRRPARWTRSTAPTTSSRRSRSCATTCRSGCP